MKTTPQRRLARVLFHTDGYTMVNTNFGIAGNVKIPTEAIPPHLRAIGSVFAFIENRVDPSDTDTDDEKREAARIIVEELTDEDRKFGLP